MNRVPDVSCPTPSPSLCFPPREMIPIYCRCSGFHLQRPTRNFCIHQQHRVRFKATLRILRNFPFSSRRGNKKRQQPAPESRLKRVQERWLRSPAHTPLQGKGKNQNPNWPGGLKRGLTSLLREEKTQAAPSLLVPCDPP